LSKNVSILQIVFYTDYSPVALFNTCYEA